MMMTPTPIKSAGREWERQDQLPATEDSSIVDVAMGLGTILLVEQERTSPREGMGAPNVPGPTPLTGYEQVIKDLV